MSGSRLIYPGVAALLLAVFVVSAVFFARVIGAQERESLAQNDAIARSVAASIEAREEGYLNVLRAYAGRFQFRESVKRRDRVEALVHLRQLHRGFSDLDRVFLADPAGIVWATQPETPEIHGRSDAFRDWYQGVSRAWQPYMSEVYETDLGHALAVAFAVPIRDLDDRVIGIIASVQRLEGLRRWLEPVEIPGGDVFVVDRKGQLVFHRTRTGAARLRDYVGLPVVRRVLEGRDGMAELQNPVDGDVNLSAYRWLARLGWGVVVHRTKNVALERTRTLLLVSGAAGVLLAATLTGLGALALRNERRIAAAQDRLRAEVAERRGAEDASFRLLFAGNPLPMWVYDLATLHFLEVNGAAIAHYGYTREEFLRMRISDIRPPEDVPRLQEALTGLETETDAAVRRHTKTWRHRLKDGRVRDVDIASHALDFGGRRASLVVAIDVTELKEAEASLAKATERLKILHEIDRALIATQAPVAIAEAVLPRLRDLLGVPRAIVNLFDLAAGEVEWLAAAGRRRVRLGPGVRFPLALMGDVDGLRRGEPQVVDVAALPQGPDAEALLRSGVQTYMVVPMIAGGELIGGVSFGGATSEFSPEQIGIAQEVAAQLAIALEQARLLERVQGQAVELEQRVRERTLELSSANDQLQREITERRRAEEEADRANRAKSDFLSRMSHELRTPLNSIIGFAQLLELEIPSAEHRESIEQILRGGRHLLGLINEVLDIARIEAGKLAISPEPVQVGEVLRAAVDLIRPQAAARSIEVLEPAPAERYVIADRQRLQQVLLNLLSNAVKYNREGGAVRVACEDGPPGRLRLTVTDTGGGIAPELMDRLFRPFERLGAEHTPIEGTGLGLALALRLVEAMSGTLTAASTMGQGTTFTVELQRADGPPLQDAAVAAGEARDGAPGQVRGTVLYIEDNLSNLRLLERILARRPGVTLLSAMQGRRGLELAHDHRPDLILLDLHLPDVPGMDVLARLLADPATKPIPVVILSADATPGRISRLIERGARAYLTKPLDVQQLLAMIDDILGTVRNETRWPT